MIFKISMAVLLLIWIEAPLRGDRSTANPLTGVKELIATGRVAEARARLQEAVDVYRSRGDRQGEAICFFLLGMTATDPAAASAHLERSAAAFELHGDRFGAWSVVHTLAELSALQTNLEASMTLHQRALALIREAETSTEPVSPASYKYLGELFGLPMPTEALELIALQPGIFKPFLLGIAEAMSRSSFGKILIEAGRLDEAEAELSRAAELSHLFEGPFNLSRAVRFGDLRRRQWRLEEARESYRKALDGVTSKPVRTVQDEGLVLEILGQLEDVEILRGRVDDALAWNDRVLEVARRHGDRILEISARQGRGNLLMKGNRFSAAESTLTEALGMAQNGGYRFLQALIEKDLGVLLMLGGRYEKAAGHLETAVRLLQGEGAPLAEAQSWALLAGAYLHLESSVTASATLEKARELARNSGSHESEVTAELFAAMERFRSDPRDSSEIEELIESLGGPPEAKASWRNVQMCFEALAGIAGSEPPLPFPSPGTGAMQPSGPPGYARFVQGLLHFQRGEIAAARDLWTRALEESPTREKDAGLLIALGWSYERERRLEEAIPYFIRAVDAIELTAEGVHVEELLATFLGSHNQGVYRILIAMLVRQGRPEEAFDYAERARARAFLQLLGNRRREPSRGADAQLAEEARILRIKILEWEQQALFAPPREQAQLAADLKNARQRYQALTIRLKSASPEHAVLSTKVEPLRVRAVQEELPADATLISYFVSSERIHAWVLDRDIFQHVALPLGLDELQSAACWADEVGRRGAGRGLRVLGPECRSATAEEVYEKLITPLADKIRHARLILVPHDVLHHLPFAALRNPRTGRYFIEEHTLTYAPGASVLRFLRGRETPVAGRALVLGDPASSAPNLEPLPAAQREARAVAGFLDTSPVLGPQATESLLHHLNGQVDLLHIAAHGLYDSASPLFSRIALAPGQDHDGHLEVHEILADLDLSGVNLVVLSACQTAVGERSGGDEIVGLTRAFLYAGSPGVISTLWNIDDAAAAVLMEAFYRRLLNGAPAAEALREAQLVLLRHPLYKDPYFWAAFHLTGDPQGRWQAAVESRR